MLRGRYSRTSATQAWSAVAFAVMLSACVVPDESQHGPVAAVASASPEATRVGLDVLRQGGNAIDAAVAVSLALGVSEPAGSGIAGQVFVLLHPPGGPAVVINGSTRAPSALPGRVVSGDISGRRASTVPSALAVLDLAHRRYGSGTMSWSRLVQPAADLAENGVGMGHFRRTSMQRYAPDLLAPRRPKLGATLRRVANHGAADFYRGDMAREMPADMAEHGGWITYDDLAEFPEPRIMAPLRGSYRGYTVHTLPPPTGGWVVLHALDQLQEVSPVELASEQGWVPAMAEALFDAHRERLNRPVGAGGGETTHFCVIDGEGTVVSVTQSINNYFGSKVEHPGLGFLYNDYMREFVLDQPGHPFELAPGALPYSSMSATILSRDGRAILGLGSPGSRRIISAVVQVVSNFVDRGMDVDAAVAAPRLHVLPENKNLLLEQLTLPSNLLSALEGEGFKLSTPRSSLDRDGRSPYFGGVHAVSATTGGVHAAADPRRDGIGTVIALPTRKP